MKIIVSFDEMWTIEDAKAFIANPKDPKFTELAEDKYLEIAACAAVYKESMSVHEMNSLAARSIEGTIECDLQDELYSVYISELVDELPVA